LSSTDKRKPSPDLSDEGLVNISFRSYFLQHLPGQHFPLPLQQSAAGDVAVAVLMQAAKVAIKRRYFIRSSFSVLMRNSATISLAPSRRLGERAARRWHRRTLSARRYALVANANRSD
jgi:hypothetical protein